MNRIPASLAVVALSIGLVGCTAASQGHAPDDGVLQAQDYLDVRQLIDSYSHILDNCTNNGNTYADLFTPDATFGVSSEWGSGAKIWFRGRSNFAACADRLRRFWKRLTAPGTGPFVAGA